MLELLNTMEKNQGWGIVLGEGAGVFSLRKHHLSKPKDLGEEVVTRGKSIPERVISKSSSPKVGACLVCSRQWGGEWGWRRAEAAVTVMLEMLERRQALGSYRRLQGPWLLPLVRWEATGSYEQRKLHALIIISNHPSGVCVVTGVKGSEPPCRMLNPCMK